MQRIFEKIQADEAGCWIFTGATTVGYGVIGIGGRIPNALGRQTAPIEYVHRIMYAFYNGPIPDGLHIDHLCRVRRCCNPLHLEPVTQAENNQRAWDARKAMSA